MNNHHNRAASAAHEERKVDFSHKLFISLLVRIWRVNVGARKAEGKRISSSEERQMWRDRKLKLESRMGSMTLLWLCDVTKPPENLCSV